MAEIRQYAYTCDRCTFYLLSENGVGSVCPHCHGVMRGYFPERHPPQIKALREAVQDTLRELVTGKRSEEDFVSLCRILVDADEFYREHGSMSGLEAFLQPAEDILVKYLRESIYG